MTSLAKQINEQLTGVISEGARITGVKDAYKFIQKYAPDAGRYQMSSINAKGGKESDAVKMWQNAASEVGLTPAELLGMLYNAHEDGFPSMEFLWITAGKPKGPWEEYLDFSSKSFPYPDGAFHSFIYGGERLRVFLKYSKDYKKLRARDYAGALDSFMSREEADEYYSKEDWAAFEKHSGFEKSDIVDLLSER